MSETSLRNSTRTPNIFQNVELSPNQSSKVSDTTLSPGSTKSIPSAKMQTLRQRKTDLDNLLIEKNNLLQQLCREEAKLLANCSVVGNDVGLGIDCSDGHSMNAALRRRVETGFKLPENLLNSKEDEINKYLLSKQIQQQISEASLKLANDMSQTKSIRRAHRQNYEAAQQKLMNINQNLSMLKKRPNIDTSDSINNNNNNNMIMPERRNSTISNSSSQLKVRKRCDSYSGLSTCVAPSNGNLSPSTMAGGSYYMPQHLHYSNHNHLAEKVVYVTNAVAAAAAEAKNSANASSPKYGRLRNPLTVDTSDKFHYPSAGSAGTISYQQRQSQPPPLSYQHQTMHGHGPYLNKLNFTRNNFTSKSSPSIGNGSDDNGDGNDDDDDIAGQYATLLTLTQQPSVHNEYNYPISNSNNNNNNNASMGDGAESPEPETHYSVIKKPSSATLPNESTSTTNTDSYDHLPKHQGLGGYWTTSENNERIWCSIDNRYSSLDRKSQKNKIKKTIGRNTNQPIKSTSLGNFNFLNKPDEILDAISITSAVSDQRKSKEKQWLETSLDTPVMSPQPISPPIYYRDKKQQHQHQSQQQQQQLLSPPYYHSQAIAKHHSPTIRASDIPHITYIGNSTTLETPPLLRRTASNISSAKTMTSHVPSPVVTATAVATNDSFTYQNNTSISSNNLSQSSDIHIESPKNMTIIQQAKFQPYKEVTKPFEMSDFYKYSTKFRQKTGNVLSKTIEPNSPQLPPKNVNVMQKSSTMPSYTVHNQ